MKKKSKSKLFNDGKSRPSATMPMPSTGMGMPMAHPPMTMNIAGKPVGKKNKGKC